MALAKRLAAILLIESRRTFAQHLHPAPVERLAATTDTTARTCHNFDGMIGRHAVFDFFNQSTGIAQTMCNSYFYRCPIEVYCCTANAFQPAEFFKINFRKSLFRI